MNRYRKFSYKTPNPVFSDLLGKTLTSIDGAEAGNDVITFRTSEGEEYELYHSQDCCESVDIAEVIGDVADLIGSPLTMAEEVSEEGQDTEYGDTSTWTFYKLATVKGYVTFRWLGRSNGYYSESVSFAPIAVLPEGPTYDYTYEVSYSKAGEAPGSGKGSDRY